MVTAVLVWGLVVGVVHFIVVGVLYTNPLVGPWYKQAQQEDPAVKAWPSVPRYLLTMFCGTQIEVYIVCGLYLWLRGYVPLTGMAEVLVLGGALAAVRVYPRCWNMWIQSTYPPRLLAVELVNGVIGTLVMVGGIELVT